MEHEKEFYFLIKKYIKPEIQKIFQKKFSQKFYRKADQSLVGEIDLHLSDIIQEIFLRSSFKDCTYICEEKKIEQKNLLNAIIVDPIDGTRQLSRNIPEFVTSIAYSKEALGWLFNPITGFEISTQHNFKMLEKRKRFFTGLVSVSEWERGFFKSFHHPEIRLIPVGSIAFKLGLFAAGGADFVLSLNPKNIWDIAGATFILKKRGATFFSSGIRTTKMSKLLWSPPLLWSHLPEELENFILNYFALGQISLKGQIRH